MLSRFCGVRGLGQKSRNRTATQRSIDKSSRDSESSVNSNSAIYLGQQSTVCSVIPRETYDERRRHETPDRSKNEQLYVLGTKRNAAWQEITEIPKRYLKYIISMYVRLK